MEEIAKKMLELPYSDLLEMACELVAMQRGAKEDGWEWKPDEVHGEYGMMQMLYSWAESKA